MGKPIEPSPLPEPALERMRRTTRLAIGLIEGGRTVHWLALVALAVSVSVLEAFAALLIFTLLGALTSPQTTISLPLLGDLRALAPGISRPAFFVSLVALAATLFVVRGLAVIFQSYAQSRVAWNTGLRLSSRIQRGYLSMPYTFYLRRNSADLIRTCFESVNQIVGQVFAPAVLMVSEGITALAILTILVMVAPVPTLVAIPVFTVVVFTLIRSVRPRLEQAGAMSQAAAADTIRAIQQSLAGIREIRVLGRERYFHEEFVRHRRQGVRALVTHAVFLDLPRVTLETFVVLGLLGVLATTVVSGNAAPETLSVLGVFAYAVLRMMPSANRLLTAANNLRFGATALRIVSNELDALDSRLQEPEPEGSRVPLLLREAIVLEDLSFRYEAAGPDVLRGVNLRIKRGESVGFVGPTGGGKTTLIDIILGLLTPTGGRILIDGIDLQERLPQWQASLGVVHQAPFLIDDTLRRNIALGREDDDIDDAAVREAAHLARLDEFVEQLPQGLDSIVGERGMRLSGGQRQRVAIARALYHRPPVLIFDEGTSALDNVTEAAVITALDQLRRERTILTVAHRLSTVRACDWIAVIEGGEVTATGSFDELLDASPSFRAMVR